MTSFSDVIAEAAWVISVHGFTLEEHGGEAGRDGWNALVEVSASTLGNIDEWDLSARFAAEVTPDPAGALVWVRQTDDGHVRTVMHGTDAGTRSGTDAVSAAWDKFVEEAREEEEEAW